VPNDCAAQLRAPSSTAPENEMTRVRGMSMPVKLARRVTRETVLMNMVVIWILDL
jgi:hypothetical protein